MPRLPSCRERTFALSVDCSLTTIPPPLDCYENLEKVTPSQAMQIDIIRLLMLTGYRKGEIVRLKKYGVFGISLRLRDSKTGPRTVFLNAEARLVIDRRMAGVSASLFPSPLHPGRPLCDGLPLWCASSQSVGRYAKNVPFPGRPDARKRTGTARAGPAMMPPIRPLPRHRELVRRASILSSRAVRRTIRTPTACNASCRCPKRFRPERTGSQDPQHPCQPHRCPHRPGRQLAP